ncbi:uncharacterized protein LOC122238084 [Panthera tigris]|uniref:uncharacterized protein LOC122238084 n=1 Tax=Panthera tigris TaxID=9694 RepID=UPI001C6FB828|nr:uncharacterized protein LOC122238084 [Panthera tigris]
MWLRACSKSRYKLDGVLGSRSQPSWELSWCNLKPAAAIRGQGETEERGRPPWVEFYKEALTGPVKYTVQVFSTAHHHLNTVSLEQPLGAGKESLDPESLVRRHGKKQSAAHAMMAERRRDLKGIRIEDLLQDHEGDRNSCFLTELATLPEELRLKRGCLTEAGASGEPWSERPPNRLPVTFIGEIGEENLFLYPLRFSNWGAENLTDERQINKKKRQR